MCGISGIVASDRLAPDAGQRVARMRDVIAHRGPDDAGIVRRRAGGARPSPAEHRRSGGRASAARERRRHDLDRLQRRDLQPRRSPAASSRRPATAIDTRSDTETIVHAYEQWGDACVEQLRGMFAFAIWDAPTRAGCCSRAIASASSRSTGRMAGSRLLFGSEIKSILASGLIRAEPDESQAPGAAQHPLPLGRRDALQGHPPAAARPHARLRGRHGHDPAVLGRADGSRRRALASALRTGRRASSSASCSRRRCASV